MRLLIILLMTFGIGMMNPSVYAKASKPKPVVAASQQLNLYAEPSTSAKVVGKIDLFYGLIPIYQKDGWVKVGDPSDGDTGWLNMDQYKKAVDAFNKARTQTVYIQMNNTGKKGQPRLVVFENGKKVTDKKKAKKIYKDLQKDQAKVSKQMEDMQTQMDKMMQGFGPMPDMQVFPMQPVVVVVQSPKK